MWGEGQAEFLQTFSSAKTCLYSVWGGKQIRLDLCSAQEETKVVTLYHSVNPAHHQEAH